MKLRACVRFFFLVSWARIVVVCVVWSVKKDLFFLSLVYALLLMHQSLPITCRYICIYICILYTYNIVYVCMYMYIFIRYEVLVYMYEVVNPKSPVHSSRAVHNIKFDCFGPPPGSAAARLVDPPGDRAVCIKSNYDVRY